MTTRRSEPRSTRNDPVRRIRSYFEGDEPVGTDFHRVHLVPRHRGLDRFRPPHCAPARQRWVGASHLLARLLDGEQPLDPSTRAVASFFPRDDGATKVVAIADSAVKALLLQNADLDHVEPTRVLRHEVELDLPQYSACFFGGKRRARLPCGSRGCRGPRVCSSPEGSGRPRGPACTRRSQRTPESPSPSHDAMTHGRPETRKGWPCRYACTRSRCARACLGKMGLEHELHR